MAQAPDSEPLLKEQIAKRLVLPVYSVGKREIVMLVLLTGRSVLNLFQSKDKLFSVIALCLSLKGEEKLKYVFSSNRAIHYNLHLIALQSPPFSADV